MCPHNNLNIYKYRYSWIPNFFTIKLQHLYVYEGEGEHEGESEWEGEVECKCEDYVSAVVECTVNVQLQYEVVECRGIVAIICKLWEVVLEGISKKTWTRLFNLIRALGIEKIYEDFNIRQFYWV